MIKVFLSHASADKASYVGIVAANLDKEHIVYDEITFEAGEKTVAEIVRGMDDSSVFALFLSEAALQSKWVADEIALAELRLKSGVMKAVYPIIIDRSIDHQDERIPKWLREHYNLRLVARPSVAARRIHQKLRQVSWGRHPKLERRANVFIGRNQQVESLEKRFDSFEHEKPVATIVAGPPSIGRRAFLRNAMEKISLAERGYLLPSIYLDRNSSLEDFILKLLDLGLVDKSYVDLDLFSIAVDKKVDIAVDLLLELGVSGERLIVVDDGCLVAYTRDLAGWFRKIIEAPKLANRPLLFIASKWALAHKFASSIDQRIYSVALTELNESERRRLLARLLEISDIVLDKLDFETIASLLHGYPDEVYFAVDLLERYGSRGAIGRSHEIIEFNAEKASYLLRNYEGREEVLDFLRLLAQFEIYSIDFLFKAISEEVYSPILSALVDDHICEYVGAEAEFVRLNDTVRDYIKRNRLEVNPDLQAAVDREVLVTVEKGEWDEYDSSRIVYTIREALKAGVKVDSRFLIPSHFLRAMKDIYYQRGNMKRVVELADQLLLKERGLDLQLAQDVRYYLCLALARLRDKRVLEEARHIHGNEHDFVLGYYYRLAGRHKDAIERFSRIISAPWVEARVKRELVEVYIQTEQYDLAADLARRNYLGNRGNQFHIQAYFRSLIYGSEAEKHAKLLRELCDELERVGSEQARQMSMIARALVTARIDHDPGAIAQIDDAIASFPNVVYPVLAKFDIAMMFKDVVGMSGALKLLDGFATRQMSISERTFAKQRAYCAAAMGNEDAANLEIDQHMRDYPDEARAKLRERVRALVHSSRSRDQGRT